MSLIIVYPRCRLQPLDSLAARFITNVSKNTSRGVGHLRPIIEERRKYLKEYGKDWIEKPVRLPCFRLLLCSSFSVERPFIRDDG